MAILRRFTLGFLILILVTFVIACSEDAKDTVDTTPVAFHSGDECHVCGMLIVNWPGAKGQSINKSSGETLKFCSTVDLFSWWLQPENKTLQAQIYVHDMAETQWDHPEDTHLIDARKAWYVMGSNLMGAMGPTLVSFGNQTAAQNLAKEHNGKVLRFEDINLEVLQKISKAGHMHMKSHAEQIRQGQDVTDEEEHSSH